ncbi:MAG: phosphohistidine phosphatase SixA [Thermoanaerobaculia bacterium]
MKIYLVQHGEAKSEQEDPERGLTEKGIEDLHKIGKFLQKMDMKLDKIYHSGKKRAEQTAEILKNYLKIEGNIQKIEGISPMDEPEILYERIKDFDENIMIVGHLPHLSKFSSLLLSGDKNKNIINFKMGSVLCLSKSQEGFKIDLFLIPEIS